MIADQISVKRACGVLGIGKTSLYVLIKAGEIRSTKIGSRRLIDSASLAKLIDQNSAPCAL